MQLASIHRYPVKSMRGETLTTVAVEPWGLMGDRRWMLVDADGECVTARDHPAMLLLVPQLLEDGIRIAAPGRGSVSASSTGTSAIKVSVHGREPFEATAVSADVDRWLSNYLDAPVRLVFANDPTRRRLNLQFALASDCAAFPDGYPISLASSVSLGQVNAWIAEGAHSDEGPLPMIRFRPNLVIAGAELPFTEDTWRKIRIGGAVFRSPKGIDRCVITTTDAESAARGKEPIATLARYRRFDQKTWFGMHLIPDTAGQQIRVGDEVEVLEAEPCDGPPR